MADRDQIEDLIERDAAVAVTGPTGVTWTGTLAGYFESPVIVVNLGEGRHLTIPAHTVQVTERDVHRLAAPSPDVLLETLRRAAAKITQATSQQPGDDANERVAVALRLWHEDTAATMAETWQLLDQLMSTGVPLPTAWAGDNYRDRPAEVYETLRLPDDPADAALAWLTAWRTVLVYALTGEISDNGEPTHQALAAAAESMPKKGTP